MSDVVEQLRWLVSPDAERMSDFQRINHFVRSGHEAAAEIERLRGLAPCLDLWRPIETAPKDKAIMLCVAGWQPCSGRWWPVDGCWASFDWEGHFDTDAEMTSYCSATSFEPTHWMPLPQGPDTSTDRTNCGDHSCKDPNCAYGAGKSRCQRCGILCDHIYCVGCSDGADDLEHLDGMLDDRERE